MMTQPLLQLKNLTTVFPTRRGLVTAVNGLNLTLQPGEILGIVGESGCGKSVTMLSILRLVARPGRIAAGDVLFEGRSLLQLSPVGMRAVRGREIAMIFQDPLSTLNPAFPVGEQIRESLRLHGLIRDGRLPWPFDRTRLAAEKRRVLQVMEEVGIPSPMDRYAAYPHQFSGGMQQRALIAIALACEPKLLLADEPTTALDVTIQAQILDLMRRINHTRRTAVILVTHDLGVAAEFCHNIAVMYAGRIVERGTTDQVITNPQHPYTRGLLACRPLLGGREPIRPIRGEVPDLIDLPVGCAFHPRCEFARDECLGDAIRLAEVAAGHYARCILHTGYQRREAPTERVGITV
jgi:oligopeptide/dipeptide ABC transporter ATP-binding protein